MKTPQAVAVGCTTRGGFQAWVEVFFTPPRGDWLRRTQIHDVFPPVASDDCPVSRQRSGNLRSFLPLYSWRVLPPPSPLAQSVEVSMIFSWGDNRVRMWFSDVSGPNSVPIFRVCWWFGSTKTVFANMPLAHPEYGDGVISWNVGKHLHPDAAVCPRTFHLIFSPRKLQDGGGLLTRDDDVKARLWY